jgi:hypothetical protein
MRKHLVRALEHTEGITPTVTPRRQRTRESEKGEGETISLLKGLPEGRNTKAWRGIPHRLLLQQQQKGEESGSPPQKTSGLPPMLHSIAAGRE